MTPSRHDGPGSSRPADRQTVYTIHVGSLLGPHWAEWFEGGDIIGQEDGTTRIVVEVSDQAMLYGLLLRVHDLGVPLIGLYPGGGTV